MDKDKNIKEIEVIAEGRKRPLEEIRKKMLEKQHHFIRSHPDQHYDEMPRLEVAARLRELNEIDDSEGLTIMRKRLKLLERTRHLLIWHDHSTVANHGHLLFMCTVLYDPAFHLTTEEYKERTGREVDIQAAVEQPQVYIIARYKKIIIIIYLKYEAIYGHTKGQRFIMFFSIGFGKNGNITPKMS